MDTNPDNVAYKIFWARGVHHQYALLNRKSSNIPTGPRSVIFWACRSPKQEKAEYIPNEARSWNWRKYPARSKPQTRTRPQSPEATPTSLTSWRPVLPPPGRRRPRVAHAGLPGLARVVASCLDA